MRFNNSNARSVTRIQTLRTLNDSLKRQQRKYFTAHVQVGSRRLKIPWHVRMKTNVLWIQKFVALQFTENVRI